MLLSLCLTAINLDKSEVIWDYSRLGSNTKMLPEKKLHIAWNTAGKFKLVGIHLNLYKKKTIRLKMLDKKVEKGKKYLRLMELQGLNLYCANNSYIK